MRPQIDCQLCADRLKSTLKVNYIMPLFKRLPAL